MKTEFLQNFKVNEQPLPKEVIDAILAENGRDIENAKKPFADYQSMKEQLQTAKDGLKAFEGVDVSKLQDEVKRLNEELTRKDSEWQAKLADAEFSGKVRDAITKARGKNAKAISALLDMETLKTSKDPDKDINAALEALKKDSAYLFDTQTPPPYSGGTGGEGGNRKNTEPLSIADALRAQYNK